MKKNKDSRVSQRRSPLNLLTIKLKLLQIKTLSRYYKTLQDYFCYFLSAKVVNCFLLVRTKILKASLPLYLFTFKNISDKALEE